MHRAGAVAFLIGLLSISIAAQKRPERPDIAGLAGIRLFASNLEKTRDFYAKTLGLRECHSNAALCFQVNAAQKIEFEHLSADNRPDRLVYVALEAKDVSTLLEYMVAEGVNSTDEVTRVGQTQVLDAYDPDRHVVEFVERRSPTTRSSSSQSQVSSNMIHVGFIVQNRTAMDHFYKDILGFRPYWHGGMKDDKDDWVAMQVPNGTDWVEYMLNISPTADKHTLGVMNHIALGVPDIQAAKAQLIKNGWKPGEEPKLGRDGKWQLNLYDPDDTRVEFMEFTPKEKPCCSEFTGPHPGPHP
jgi:catechol 2,3-dioxygenase-like lactoylglutathione lyase family enzyme